MVNSPRSHDSRWIVLAAIGIPLLVLAALLFCFDPSHHGFFPKCAFHETTGLLCAGCGAARAVYQLLHGHWLAAFRFNPLLIISLPLILWFGGRQTVRYLKNQPCPINIRPAGLWLILAVLVVFTVVRNLPGLPPGLLPPDAATSPGLHAAR